MSAQLLKGVLALTLTLTMAPWGARAASAADGSPDPQQVQEAIDLFYGPTAADWSPQGTVIADSGFDPAYGSFPFINYGDDVLYNVLLGYPEGEPVVNLTSLEAQALYGVEEACTQGSGLDCVLTPPMMAWLSYLNGAQFSGGHCFGIAALVAGLYNGIVSREGLTPSQVNVGVELSPAVQRKIAELFVTQFSLTEAQNRANMLPPDQLVNQLVQFLPSGTLPYVLTLFWEEDGQMAGHGITPYAVYSRGPDLVDIAVYDNNYPLRARAVHVDLAANTWEYEVSSIPGRPPTIASGDADSLNLGLVPLTQVFQPQDCLFCYGAPEGTSMAMVLPMSEDPGTLSVDFLDTDGTELTVRPLPAVPLTNVVQVPSSDRYTIRVGTSGKAKRTLYLVQVYGPGESLTAYVVGARDGVATIDVDLIRDVLTASTTSGSQVLGAGIERDRRAIDSGLVLSQAKPYPRSTVSTDVRLSESGQVQSAEYVGTGAAHFLVNAHRVSPATGEIAAQAKVLLRKGDVVSTDLSTWRKGVAPSFVVRRADGTTTVLPSTLMGPGEYGTAVYEQPFG